MGTVSDPMSPTDIAVTALSLGGWDTHDDDGCEWLHCAVLVDHNSARASRRRTTERLAESLARQGAFRQCPSTQHARAARLFSTRLELPSRQIRNTTTT